MSFIEFLREMQLSEMPVYKRDKAEQIIKQQKIKLIEHIVKVIRYTGQDLDMNSHIVSIGSRWVDTIGKVELNGKQFFSKDDYLDMLQPRNFSEFKKLLNNNPQETYQNYIQAITDEETYNITMDILDYIQSELQKTKFYSKRKNLQLKVQDYISQFVPKEVQVVSQNKPIRLKGYQRSSGK